MLFCVHLSEFVNGPKESDSGIHWHELAFLSFSLGRPFLSFEWGCKRTYLSNEKNLGCFGVCRGLYYPVIYVGIIRNHYKDPYWTTSMMESTRVFFVALLTWNCCNKMSSKWGLGSTVQVQILGTMVNPEGKQFTSAITLVGVVGVEGSVLMGTPWYT